MLHGRIQASPRNKRECATTAYSGAKWSKKRKRWLYIYRIYPPAHRPFLPTDEALRTLISQLPDIAFMTSERFKDRDYFQVFGLKRNVFTKRADPLRRSIGLQFLQDIGEAATSEREIRISTREAAQQFLTECGFVNVEWNGRQLIAYSRDRGRYESSRVSGGIYWRPFQDLYRVSKPELPFFHGAALF